MEQHHHHQTVFNLPLASCVTAVNKCASVFGKIDENGHPRGAFTGASTRSTFMCDINCNHYHHYQVPVQWT